MPTYHLWSRYQPGDPDAQRRHALAQLSWAKLNWIDRGIPDSALPRLWSEEGRSVAYVRDLFDLGVYDLNPVDIVVYTNADIHIRSDAIFIIASILQDAEACYSYRRDFHHRLLESVKDEDYIKGHHYPGSDLVAFRVKWWRTNRALLPDLLIGREAWDPVIRTLIERTNPRKKVCVRDIICHERHGSYWENAANRYRLKGQIHNLKLAYHFLLQNGVSPRSHGIPNL